MEKSNLRTLKVSNHERHPGSPKTCTIDNLRVYYTCLSACYYWLTSINISPANVLNLCSYVWRFECVIAMLRIGKTLERGSEL